METGEDEQAVLEREKSAVTSLTHRWETKLHVMKGKWLLNM